MKSILYPLNSSLTLTSFVRIKEQKIWHNHSLFLATNNKSVLFMQEAYKHLQIAYPKFYKMDLMCKAGFIASEILLRNQVLPCNEYQKGIVLQNKNASLETDKKYQETLETIPSPALFVYTLPNIVLGEIAIRHGWKGENTFFIVEKFNANQLIQYANTLIETNVVDFLILGFLEINEAEQDILFCLLQKNTDSQPVFTTQALEDLYYSKKN